MIVGNACRAGFRIQTAREWFAQSVHAAARTRTGFENRHVVSDFVSSYPADSPAIPAPMMMIFFGAAATVMKLKRLSEAPAIATALRLTNVRRFIGMRHNHLRKQLDQRAS